MTSLTGTRRLLRLAWRRDRVMIAVTLVVLWLMAYYSAAAMKTLYASDQALITANEQANASTAVVAMYGRIVHPDSVGGIAANKVAMINFLILAFLVVAVVRRHTRAEEESGRFELLGAAPVGNLAPPAAAVTLASLTSLAAGLITIPCLIAGGWPGTGSAAFGLAQTGVGLAFAAMTAVAMQLSTSTRACSTWAYAGIGVSFMLRMVGDVSEGGPLAFLTWLSPLGWGMRVRPYDGDRFWVVVVPVGAAVALAAVAAGLHARRDLGAGLLPDRPGRASGRIGSSFALAWRLERGMLSGWLVTYLLLGLLMGSIVGTVGGLMSGPAADLLRKMGGVGQFDQVYLTMVTAIAALGAAGFGVAAVLRLRAEESAGHLEPVLATRVRRLGFLAAHLVIALVGTVVLMAVLGAALAAAYARTSGGIGFWREFGAGLVPLPAIWVMVALAACVAAWLPRLDWLGWALLAFAILLGELGALMGLPTWVLNISPFVYIPKLPVEPMNWTPVLVETLVAGVLIAIAAVGYRRRDMPVG